MQVRVNDVDPHVAGPRESDERVQVRSVAIQIRTLGVEDVRNLGDLILEDTKGVGHCQHQTRDFVGHFLLEKFEVERATRVRLELLEGVTGEGGRRGIRPVRRVGDEDVLAGIALVDVESVMATSSNPR